MNFEITNQSGAQITVRARAHLQHIWNETVLLGVSASAAARLKKFFSAHPGVRITVNAGPHNPRLVGWRGEEE